MNGVVGIHCAALAALKAGVCSPFPDGEAEGLERGWRRAELSDWPVQGPGWEGASAALRAGAGAEPWGAGPSASAPAPIVGRPPFLCPEVRGGGVQSPQPHRAGAERVAAPWRARGCSLCA